MTSLAKKFLDEAVLLPVEDRIELVNQLLLSLNSPAQKEIDDEWKIEVEKRIHEFDERKIKPVDGEKVLLEIQSRFRK